MICYFSKNHNIQFSHIPKSGCQSIRKFIIKINNEKEDMDIWSQEFSSKYMINTTQTMEGYHHYSFVRNPYDRLVSCYYNKIVGNHWESFKGYFSNSFKGMRPSFEEFVNFLENGGILKNEHWIPQVILIGNVNTKIFKIENSDEINTEMLSKTGFSFNHYKPLDHMDKRINTYDYVGDIDGGQLNNMFLKKEQPKSLNFYNQRSCGIVASLFKNDFQKFRYSFKDLK